MNTILTFDLQGEDPEDRKSAHAILATLGFAQVAVNVAGKVLPFPESTAVGQFAEDMSPRQVKRLVQRRFDAAGLPARRIFVAKFHQEGFWEMSTTSQAPAAPDGTRGTG